MATRFSQNASVLLLGALALALILLAGYLAAIGEPVPDFASFGVTSAIAAIAGIARGERTANQ